MKATRLVFFFSFFLFLFLSKIPLYAVTDPFHFRIPLYFVSLLGEERRQTTTNDPSPMGIDFNRSHSSLLVTEKPEISSVEGKEKLVAADRSRGKKEKEIKIISPSFLFRFS